MMCVTILAAVLLLAVGALIAWWLLVIFAIAFFLLACDAAFRRRQCSRLQPTPMVCKNCGSTNVRIRSRVSGYQHTGAVPLPEASTSGRARPRCCGSGSTSARTRGQATLAVKRALIPGYGKKGMGALHPKRALYNKVYRKTTFGLGDLLKWLR